MVLEQNVAGRTIAAERGGLAQRADARRARPVGPMMERVLVHLALVLVLFLVLLPVLWIVSLALAPATSSARRA
jgi:ABC-type glycerol-3-phosphate transport system permease component